MCGIDSLRACVRVDIEAYEFFLMCGIDSLHACARVDIDAYEIVTIGLALIVYVLVSLLTLMPMRFCSCVALIKSRIVPGLIRFWKHF